MIYEDVKDVYIDGIELHEEFAKCRTKLENAINQYVVDKNIKILEFKDDNYFFHDKNIDYRNPDDSKGHCEYKIFDTVGYYYDTKDYDISQLEDLKIKNVKFYLNKFLKNNKNLFVDYEIVGVVKEDNYYVVDVSINDNNIIKLLIDNDNGIICQVEKIDDIRLTKGIYELDYNYNQRVKRFQEVIDMFAKKDKSFKGYKVVDLTFDNIKIEKDDICNLKYEFKPTDNNLEITINDNIFVVDKMRDMYSKDNYVEVISDNTTFFEHNIPKLLYFELDGYVYLKNREIGTFLNHNNYVTEKLAKLYQDLAIKTTTMGNYCRNDNSNKNNLVSNALMKILRKGFKYNHRNSNKIFCYFTNIITREFNETSKAQYKISNDMEISLDSLMSSATTTAD